MVAGVVEWRRYSLSRSLKGNGRTKGRLKQIATGGPPKLRIVDDLGATGFALDDPGTLSRQAQGIVPSKLWKSREAGDESHV